MRYLFLIFSLLTLPLMAQDIDEEYDEGFDNQWEEADMPIPEVADEDLYPQPPINPPFELPAEEEDEELG